MNDQPHSQAKIRAPRDEPADELTGLVGELGELARSAPARLAERIEALSLRQQAELALRLPAGARLELLLHAPQPMRLVRTLPDAELYLTARELGPADALPLLALSSASQLQHLVDLESWRRDRYDATRSGAWVALLLEAGEPAIRRFLRAADDELLALLFQRWLKIESIEPEDMPEVHGAGHTEMGDERGMISPDGNYRLSPVIAEHAHAAARIVQIFYLDQPARYRQALWAAVMELPAEVEEQALHWRNSRLEEHGYPPWEEALAVYAAPAGLRQQPAAPSLDDPQVLPAPRSLLRSFPGDGPLTQAIDIMPELPRERVLRDVVALANRLIVADGADTGEPSAHREALEKAGGYVGIALAARLSLSPQEARQLLEQVPVVELFREGYALAAELGRRARGMVSAGWGAAHPRALELLDPPLQGRVEALLHARPAYVELREGQPAWLRSFRTMAEIEETAASLEVAETIGHLMVGVLKVDLPLLFRRGAAGSAAPPTLGTFFLTLLAWHAARGELRCDALPSDVVAAFLRNVASRRTSAPDAPARALASLLQKLGLTRGLSPRQQIVLAAFGRACLERLAAECSQLDPGIPVGPAQVSCLLLLPG